MKVKIELEPSKSPFRMFYFFSSVNGREQAVGEIMLEPSVGHRVSMTTAAGQYINICETMTDVLKVIAEQTMHQHNRMNSSKNNQMQKDLTESSKKDTPASMHRCERCNQKIDHDKTIWLECSQTDGNYYETLPYGHESQGWFPFGIVCSHVQIQETFSPNKILDISPDCSQQN